MSDESLLSVLFNEDEMHMLAEMTAKQPMTATDVIRDMIRLRDVTQSKLGEMVGGWTQSNVASLLNNVKGNIGIVNLYRIAEALDCEIVVRSKNSPDQWVIGYTDEEVTQLKYGGKKP